MRAPPPIKLPTVCRTFVARLLRKGPPSSSATSTSTGKRSVRGAVAPGATVEPESVRRAVVRRVAATPVAPLVPGATVGSAMTQEAARRVAATPAVPPAPALAHDTVAPAADRSGARGTSARHQP